MIWGLSLEQNRAIFLDRDGVINIDKTYVAKIEDFEFVPGIFQTLRDFQDKGYLLIVVTNQSGIGRGYYTSKDFHTLTAWKAEELEKRGIVLDAIYHCDHDPDSRCDCRKPEPGMLMSAKAKYDIDMQHSWLIGDKESDIKAAYNAGVPNTILVASDCSDKKGASFCVNSILDTMDLIP